MFKKLLSMALAAIMVMGMGTTAFAAENTTISTNATGGTPTTRSAPTEFTAPAILEMSMGETRIIGYIDNQPLKITLLSESDNHNARGTNKTAYKKYGITYLDKPAFNIDLEASYYHDGMYSRMVNLKGTYTIINSTFSANWDTSQNTANDTYHGMTLKVYHFSGNAEIRLEAWIIPNDVGGVTFYIS